MTLIFFSFQFPARQKSSFFISTYAKSSNRESLQLETNLIESPNLTKESLQLETTATRPLQVYRRRIQPDQTLLQAQESELEQGNELSHPSLFAPDVNNLDQLSYPSSSSHDINDLDQPSAIRKGIRECTKNPLYPIANFISL